MFRRVRKKKNGFTLIELIIVIAIIAILATLLLPKLGMVKENTNKTADISNAREIAEAALESLSANKINTGYDTWTELNGSSASAGTVKEEVQNFIQKVPKTKSKTITGVNHNSNFYVYIGTSGEVKVAVKEDGSILLYPSQDTMYELK